MNKKLTYKFTLNYSEKLWRIIIGNYQFRYEAERYLNDVRNDGFQDAWIIQF